MQPTPANAPQPAADATTRHRGKAASGRWPQRKWIVPLLCISSLLLLAIFIAVYSRTEKRQIERQVEAQLCAIADLKRDQIDNWRKERLSDAEFFRKAPFVPRDLKAYLDHPTDPRTRETVIEWMKLLGTGGRYEQFALFDAHGDLKISVPPHVDEPAAETLNHIQEVRVHHDTIFFDIHSSEGASESHLELVFPIFLRGSGNDPDAEPLAFMLLRINPARFLFPMIESWPVPSRTAETVLLCREGKMVVFLNDLRHRQRQAGHLKLPPATVDLNEELLSGKGETLNHGRDYRGVPVLRVIRQIPNSPWIVVAKIDEAEAFESLGRKTFLLASAGLAAIVAALTGLSWAWRRRELQFLRLELTAKRESDRSRLRLEELLKSALDGIITVDADDRVVAVNPSAEFIFGYERSGMVGERLERFLPVLHAAQLEPREGPSDSAAPAPAAISFTKGIRADGQTLEIEASISQLAAGEGAISMVIFRDVTERKKAEEGIQLFRALWNQSSDPFELIDADTGKLLDANESAYQDLGYMRAEFLQLYAWDINPALKEGEWTKYSRMVQEAGKMMMDGMHRRKDGSTFPTEISIQYVGLDRGYFVTAIRDVTERRRIETKLRQLSAVVEQSPVSIVITNPNGVIEYVNPKFTDLTGYSSAEAIGQTPRILKSGHQSPEVYRELWEAILAGHTWQGELLNLSKSGKQYWEWVTIAPIIDPAGTITHFVALKEDITERKQLVEEAKQRETRFRALIENGSDLITCIDQAGIIRYESPSVTRMLGYQPPALTGRSIFDFIHAEDAAMAQEKMAHLITNPGETQLAEYRFRHADGSWRVLQSVGAYHPESLEPIVVSSRDVTAQRQLESQFRQAQKMEAVGRLAGGIAHDFNNILGVIIGHTSLLANLAATSEDVRESIDEIEQAAERAASLTKQLLLFSRQHVIEPRVVCLNQLILESEKMLRRMIGEDIILSTPLASNLPFVRIDAAQFGQVLMNLAVNARDAMPRGGRLFIETASLAGPPTLFGSKPLLPGGWVRLTVRDSGTGMDRETKAHIFEPFFTTKGVHKGTGLGLSVVQGVVKESGGAIEVESEVGAGSSFHIYFPAVESDLTRCPSNSKDRPAGGSETILLVEDEPALRKLTAISIQQLGYTVLVAESGAEALAIAGGHAGGIDLLVTDVVMPNMSGRELADRLHVTHPDLPVLYLSGYTDDAVVRHGVMHAEVAFLQKPFRVAALADKLRKVLDEYNAAPLPASKTGGAQQKQSDA